MKSMRGLLHTTSLQEAQERRQASYSAAPVAGQKRSWSSNDRRLDESSNTSRNTIQFQRAISLPTAPARLSASSIVSAQSQRGTSEYSQRKLIAATPSSSQDPELSLAHRTYGLPTQLVSNFASLGIKQIYPWQKNCLKGPGLLDGEKNLVYCAPTGGGKSLVADLLMLKRILGEPGCKALLVLPYVALVQEKANALVNQAIDDCSIIKLRAVVLDELHMVDDDHRGYLLELIATKLLSMEQPIQIVGMSATLPNMNLVADWLGAHCYETRYRPIPIDEHLVCEGKIFAVATPRTSLPPATQLSSRTLTAGLISPDKEITKSLLREFSDPVLNSVVALAHETASNGHGALVFAGSRGVCESDARWISRVMPDTHSISPVLLEKRLDLLGDLRSLSTGVDPVLEETVLYGVAFHHFVHQSLDKSLEEIQRMGLAAKDTADCLVATQLGKAIVASAIDPDDGVFVHRELTKALRAFVMDGEMHILYVFTPVQDFGVIVNWQVFRNEMELLDESGLRVMNFLGIKPTSILKLARGASLKENTSEEKELARVYRRFYLALQLRDLCNETPIHVVSRKYDTPRGTVQTLSQTCQGFAAGMIKFCDTMGWGVMAAALEHFSDRLMAGARTDLLALAKIPFIKSRTARVFWESGYRSVASIANADPKELLPVLMQAQPNKIRLKGRDDDKLEEKLLAKAEVITTAANRLWQVQLQAEMEEE
ncbi:helicase and polymerase containing protein tebichi [Purpureocillium lavendulum]|uniref:Helicase and polymerase containing protein tebichi n=1 Tax=Purpureocillium lavendulum TaxID=1247861 RepID=A0AB34G662_9HYPO|nr:helicase and polymerase containing protein tebichi [Purpureocillium lavendulum]